MCHQYTFYTYSLSHSARIIGIEQRDDTEPCMRLLAVEFFKCTVVVILSVWWSLMRVMGLTCRRCLTTEGMGESSTFIGLAIASRIILNCYRCRQRLVVYICTNIFIFVHRKVATINSRIKECQNINLTIYRKTHLLCKQNVQMYRT